VVHLRQHSGRIRDLQCPPIVKVRLLTAYSVFASVCALDPCYTTNAASKPFPSRGPKRRSVSLSLISGWRVTYPSSFGVCLWRVSRNSYADSSNVAIKFAPTAPLFGQSLDNLRFSYSLLFVLVLVFVGWRLLFRRSLWLSLRRRTRWLFLRLRRRWLRFWLGCGRIGSGCRSRRS
jgi:hypothetical protein